MSKRKAVEEVPADEEVAIILTKAAEYKGKRGVSWKKMINDPVISAMEHSQEKIKSIYHNAIRKGMFSRIQA